MEVILGSAAVLRLRIMTWVGSNVETCFLLFRGGFGSGAGVG